MTDAQGDRLDAAIKAELPAYQAPDTLRARVREALAREAGRSRMPVRSLALAATLVIAAFSAWTLWGLHVKALEHAQVAREVAQAYERVVGHPEIHVTHLHQRDVDVQLYARGAGVGAIAVFTWAEAGETGAPRAATVGNHHLLYWKHGGVEWWVVGDNAGDVTRFAAELKAKSG